MLLVPVLILMVDMALMSKRIDTITLAKKVRQHVLEMISTGGSSHIASVFSAVDILSVLYGAVMRIDPKKPNWSERDRFILSKGHGGAGVYAILAELGFIPKAWLKKHYQNGSLMSGHVSHKGISGVEWSTGSLGHGLSVGVGMAKTAKLDGKKFRTFVVLSDGECEEGTTLEAALFASHHKLDNLCVVVDYNKMQCIGSIEETLCLEPFRGKWESFGWAVKEVNGHNHNALKKVFSKLPFKKGKPSVVIAHTTRGKGVSFMEKDGLLWYFRTPKGEEYEAAKKELYS